MAEEDEVRAASVAMRGELYGDDGGWLRDAVTLFEEHRIKLGNSCMIVGIGVGGWYLCRSKRRTGSQEHEALVDADLESDVFDALGDQEHEEYAADRGPISRSWLRRAPQDLLAVIVLPLDVDEVLLAAREAAEDLLEVDRSGVDVELSGVEADGLGEAVDWINGDPLDDGGPVPPPAREI